MSRHAHTPQERAQATRKHPDRYQRDLSPNHMAGQNIGVESAGDRVHTRVVADVKELVNFLSGFTMDEMRQIPVVTPGERLSQGRTYVDLTSDDREPFTATGQMTAQDGQWLVPKADTPHMYWNRLTHAEPAERQE
jgi:hypothetical protein